MSRLVLLVCVAACARPLPPRSASAALYRDISRLVTVQETIGWTVDDLEVDKILGDALVSICAVPPQDRFHLAQWLRQEIRDHGGPVEAAWRKRGKDLSRVDYLLELTRIQRTINDGMARVDACPFWIEPNAQFAGNQISDNRWTLSFGGGGKLIGVSKGGDADVRFGGAGRFLIGRNFGQRWAVYSGIEIGGSASFPDDMGERGSLVLGYDIVAPVVVRYRRLNTYYEFEGGYLAHGTENDVSNFDSGFRVGVSIGGRATKTRILFPGAAFGIAYERSWPSTGAPLNALKFGFRVAFDLDL